MDHKLIIFDIDGIPADWKTHELLPGVLDHGRRGKYFFFAHRAQLFPMVHADNFCANASATPRVGSLKFKAQH